ncbi:MAG: hypothetical protein WC155_07420 [Candidatus Cloacimonadales bacterium]
MSCKNIDISKEEINDFLLFVYFGKDDSHIDNCINRAYRDFNRTLHKFGKLENKKIIYLEAKECIKETLIQASKNVAINNQESFDKWHKEFCLSIVKIFADYSYDKFYIGQAQKWINMTIKYFFVFQDKIKDFEKLYQYSHIPIDNIIIDKLEYKDFNTSWSRNNDYDEYLLFQKYIRSITGDMTPLEFEFRLFTQKK